MKENNIKIFNDTLDIIKKDIQLNENTNLAITNTKLYKTNDLEVFPCKIKRDGNIFVINERTLKAAKGYEDVVVLNFASGTNVGGGVTKGSNAQEECICRCSNLYPCLNQAFLWRNYYRYHRDMDIKNNLFLYSDRMIYTKGITVFKDDTINPTLLPKNDWYNVNVITSPAPNLRMATSYNNKEIYEILKNRIEKILKIAILNGNKNIVLGAFGCGAFKNDPKLVAKIFHELLNNYRYYFDNIIFAVLVTPGKDGKENFDIFSNEFKA